MMNTDELKYMVESVTGGKNTVLVDEAGNANIMVKIPKQTYASLGLGKSEKVHPAFIVNGVEKDYIYVSKYQNVIENGCAVSLPGRDPAGGNVDFAVAKAASEAKGKGWHLMTNAEWAAVALWCQANGYIPAGNTFFGRNHEKPWESGLPGLKDDKGQINRTLTGTGPVSWAHNHAEDGIYDLCGNVWEWSAGARLYDGEIQVIPDNDAAAGNVDFSGNSPLWKAVLPDDTLVAPGTEGTLKWDYAGEPETATNAFYLSTQVEHRQSGNTAFGTDKFARLGAKPGVAVPDLLKALALMPTGKECPTGQFWVRNEGERFTLRGGCWTRKDEAGIFALNMFGDRFHIAEAVGFRSCYIEE